MNRKLTGLSQQYHAALRRHLEQGPRASLTAARGLGRQAMTLGLETLHLARLHERALISLVVPADSPVTRDGMVRRAGAFFAEAITPIEQTHRLARETNLSMDRMNQTLLQRGQDLAASNRELKEEIARRQSVEASLRKSQQHYSQLLGQSRHMQEQLRLLSRQLLSAQEEERKKISRELHDVIAQTLTSIDFRLAALKKDAALNTRGLERSIGRTQTLVQRSVEIVHRFARDLRPMVLDDLGLIPALRSFMTGFTRETGIRVSLCAFDGMEQVNGDKRTVFYRVAKEALTNVARHSQASQAEVKILNLNGAICLSISDNGKGFQSERVLQGKNKGRLGLLGMRERLDMVGGSFTVTSAPGKGTTVMAKIPLRDPQARAGNVLIDRADNQP
jgi:signal transduction histidine kinase